MYASERFPVSFSSTDDPDLDAELIKLEDSEHTLEEILDICRRYGVRARIARPDGSIQDIRP